MEKVVSSVIDPLSKFAKDSERLLRKCNHPDWAEFKKIGLATIVGFFIMGFIGFFVKLIYIPINNIIIGT